MQENGIFVSESDMDFKAHRQNRCYIAPKMLQKNMFNIHKIRNECAVSIVVKLRHNCETQVRAVTNDWATL